MIPNLFFKKKVPEKTPPSMIPAIEMLKRCKSKKECLLKAYNILTQKYYGRRLFTYLLLPRIFMLDPERIWERAGFLHCHAINYMMRMLLMKSGFFKEKDIEQKLTFVWYVSIHQYLKVNIGEYGKKEEIIVDLWGKNYGMRLGEHSHGFHGAIFRSVSQ